MIIETEGNLLQADVEALVNTVNCVGHMGKGIALQFKRAFPENTRAYKAACQREEIQPGRMFTFATGLLTNPKYIINFPTKRHWRGMSKLEDIESGLVALQKEVERLNVRSLAIPPLGCGLGGLDWNDVAPLIRESFEKLHGVRMLLFSPVADRTPPERADRTGVPW